MCILSLHNTKRRGSSPLLINMKLNAAFLAANNIMPTYLCLITFHDVIVTIVYTIIKNCISKLFIVKIIKTVV